MYDAPLAQAKGAPSDDGMPPQAPLTPEQQQQLQKAHERADAMNALKDKVQVIDPNDPEAASCPKSPDQVSPEEFNRLAEQYAAIKRGDTDLKIDTSNMDEKTAKEFRDGAMNDFATMMSTPTGRALLNGVTDNHDVSGVHHTTTVGGLPPGADGPSSSGADEHNSDHVGEDARVQYAPGETMAARCGRPAATSDEVLVHELVHAYDRTHGDQPDGPVTNPVVPRDQGVSGDEYRATGLGGQSATINGVPVSENAYRADRRALGYDSPNRPSYRCPVDPGTPVPATP
jgi:hypothetical protein